MAKILLGVTGSVAALKTPELFTALQIAGHDVKIVVTQAALYFFDPHAIPVDKLLSDEDEWPDRQQGTRWQRTDPVLHIELRRWAELLLIAPLDANTLAKLAIGLCDNCLTCIWRAWDFSRPVLLAPAMNTLMWENPQTLVHLRSLAQLQGCTPPEHLSADQTLPWINDQNLPSLRFVGPIEKNLVCGDIGQGAMAEVTHIVDAATFIMNGKR